MARARASIFLAPFYANCMTGRTSAEQFARYLRVADRRGAVLQTCKWLCGNSLGYFDRNGPLPAGSLSIGSQATVIQPPIMTKASVMVLALITRLGALTLLLGQMGCTGDQYDQSTTQHIEDSRTAERVREALAANADYKYDGVKVMASNGLLKLSGSVNTSAQQSRAAEISRRVVGVKSVENDLTLKN
jgi:hypothetical protein